jgi:hypothetical protein
MAREWNQAVFAKGLTHFHMIDCAHGVNEFEKLTLAERIELATSLIGLIKTNIVRGLGAAVIESEYDLLMPYHQNIGGPYNYCLWENMLA